MNNDNFLIEESDLEQAQDVCKEITLSDIRNRAVANALAADIAKKYFTEVDVDTESGLHAIAQVLKDIDIADIYIKGNYIDVRLFFENQEICIPKSHFDRGLLPVAYMVIKLDSELSGGLVEGFILSNNVDTTKFCNGYYKINEEDLVSFYDIEGHLVSVYEEDLPDDFDSQIFDYLDGTLKDSNEFYKKLLESKIGRIRLKEAASVQNIFNNISTAESESKEVLTEARNSEFDLLDESNSDIEFSLDEPVEELQEAEITDSDEVEEPLLQEFDEIESLQEDELYETAMDEPLIQQEDETAFLEETDISNNSLDTHAVSLDETVSDFDIQIDDTVSPLDNNEELHLDISDESAEDSDFNISMDTLPMRTIEEQEINMQEDSPAEIRMQTDLESRFNSFDNTESIKIKDFENQSKNSLKEDSTGLIEFEEASLEEEPAVENNDTELETLHIVEDTAEPLSLFTDDHVKEEEMASQKTPETDNIAVPFADMPDSAANIDEDLPMEEKSDFSTNVTPSIDSIDISNSNENLEDLLNSDKSIFEEEENPAQENENQIEELFGEEHESEEVLEENFVAPAKKGGVKILPVLGILTIIAVLGYFGYTKFVNPESPAANDLTDSKQEFIKQEETTAPVQDAMPIETVENEKPASNTNEGNSISIPAIEQNLDASILVSNLSVNWEVPAGYVSNNTAKRYFTKMGEIIQLNLKTELLLLNKPPITNKIMLELEFNKTQNKFEVKGITASSGENTVDDIIVHTVKKALDINLNTNMSTFSNIAGNPILIIRL